MTLSSEKPVAEPGLAGSLIEGSTSLRRAAGAAVVDNFFRGLSVLGRFDPRNDPQKQDVEVFQDVPYKATGDPGHLLAVFRPADAHGSLPVILYIHGGGFRILSKDTHFGMAMQFARRGYLVFNINYRLAPRHPYPAAVQDACHAYEWVVEHAEGFGGDLGKFILAGESAGGNLVASLTAAASWRRDEPWARAVYDTEVVPRAVLPACGMFQVSNIERLTGQEDVSWFIADRLEEIPHAYLGRSRLTAPDEREMADPLLIFERGITPDRKLPAFFLPVGTKDVLIDDTRRMEAALDELGVQHRACYYPGEIHAFHAFIWRRQARKCWGQKFAFLEEHVG